MTYRQQSNSLAEGIISYLIKLEELDMGKFPDYVRPEFENEIDTRIERMCAIRNSLTPTNQSAAAMMAMQTLPKEPKSPKATLRNLIQY